MKKTILQRENNRETGAAAVAPAFGRSGTSGKELSAKIIFLICALFSIVAVLMIVFYLLFVSIPAFREIGVFNFLFKKLWNSDRWADGGDPSEYFGILPEIVSSLVITLGAVLLGGLLGVCSAIFMVYYCPKKSRDSIPSSLTCLRESRPSCSALSGWKCWSGDFGNCSIRLPAWDRCPR